MKNVLYITTTLPALTVTFIYKEIYRLRSRGIDIDTVSMNTPRDAEVSSETNDLRQSTRYLDRVGLATKLICCMGTAIAHPIRMSRCIWALLSASPTRFPRDYARLAYHLLEAGYLAFIYRHRQPDHIHCHFIHGPTSIGMFLSTLMGIQYSFTMHASMIWLDPIAFRNKLETCAFCVSISEYNKRYVVETYGDRFASKIHIVHCGIDPESAANSKKLNSGTRPITILGVGQLNARKGFHILIPALKILSDSGIEFQCNVVGEGAERSALAAMIEKYSLQSKVELLGALRHEEVIGQLEAADVFVLPCVVSEDGWRDGIPVALMEAMHHRLPVISTDILGLPELIDHDLNGILVPAGVPDALAHALSRLATDPALRERMGLSGRAKVSEQFNNDKSAARLAELFDAC